MYVAIPSNVFVRNYGPYTYLFNQCNWSETLIEGIGPFGSILSRSAVSVESVVQEIAKNFEVPATKVHCDIMDLISSLVAEGYLLARERVELCQNVLNGRACGSKKDVFVQKGVDALGIDSPFAETEPAKTLLLKYFISRPTPFELGIDLTRACTERCVHCYVPGFQNVFLSYEVIEKVLSEFAMMGGLKVKLTGGECMLHPDFERIVALARANDMVISVLSNLTCCDLEKAQAMKDAGVAVVQVSLYGMTPETHEAVTRVRGSLAKTLRGIEMLQKTGVSVQIHCPVLKQNVVGIDAVARYGRERGMKTTFDAVMMSRADHGCNESCGLSDAELQQFIEANEELPDKLTACPEMGDGERVCEIGTSKLCLSAEGKYYPCNGCYGLILGDCRRQTLAEVWDDEPIKRLRALRMRDLSACRVCPNRMFCAPCPARNYNANGDLTLSDAAMCKAAACRRSIVKNRTKED